MSGILLDTCAFAWMLQGEAHLSDPARTAIETGLATRTLFVSAVTFFEIAQKVRVGKWPEMKPFVHDLVAHSYLSSSAIVPLDGDICLAAALMSWSHRDPFDRLIAQTAMQRGLTIVSTDTVFDGIAPRLW